MKKKYINPVAEIVDIAVAPIMTTTSVIASLGEEDGGVVVMISTNQMLPVAIGVESGTECKYGGQNLSAFFVR